MPILTEGAYSSIESSIFKIIWPYLNNMTFVDPIIHICCIRLFIVLTAACFALKLVIVYRSKIIYHRKYVPSYGGRL